jgi:hypothetical protein
MRSVSANHNSIASAYLPIGKSAQRVARDVWTESFLYENPIWDIIQKKGVARLCGINSA